jgi:cytochrome c oxidase subunit II
MQSGQTLTADESYIRESIVNPQARLVEGYPPIMPTYQGLISEEGLLQLTAYIKSLTAAPAAPTGPAAATASSAAPPPAPERKSVKP